MSSTVLRLGLWIILLVVAMYVLQQTFEDAPFVDFFAPAMLQKALVLGGFLVAAGIVLRILERGAKAVIKNQRPKPPPAAIEKPASSSRTPIRRVIHDHVRRSLKT